MNGDERTVHPPSEDRDTIVITDAEWRAVLTAARALRDAASALRSAGAPGLAAESERGATELEDLARRAEVAAERDVEAER